MVVDLHDRVVVGLWDQILVVQALDHLKVVLVVMDHHVGVR